MQLAFLQADPETGALTLLAGDPADDECEPVIVVILPKAA